MKLVSIVITILLISGLILGCWMFMYDLRESYGVDIDSDVYDFNNTLQKINKTLIEINKSKTTIEGMSLDPDAGTSILIPYKMIKVAWSGVKIVFNSFGLLFSFITGGFGALSTSLSIPFWIEGIIIGIIIIIVIFVFVKAFLRWDI